MAKQATELRPNYSSGLAAQDLSSVPPPTVLPMMDQAPAVVKKYEFRKMKMKDGVEVDIMTFTVQFTDWSPEVPDNERLDGEGKYMDITKKSARMDYWDNERGRYDLAQFLLSCGLKGSIGPKFSDWPMIPEAIGCVVTAKGAQKVIEAKDGKPASTVFNLVALKGTQA